MRGRAQIATGIVLLVLLGTGPAVGGAVGAPGAVNAAVQDSCNFGSVYDRTIDSVVTVRVFTPQGSGLGSGFAFDSEGHIVTNQHVIADASRIEIQFRRGEWRTAEVVGTDVFSDLAVLKVEDVPEYVQPLPLSEARPEPGQQVAALGSPLGLETTLTEGIISGTNRSLPAGGQQGPQFPIPNAVQTTAAINPGNSGGPLVTCDGRVVGVNTATFMGSENIGFAIPASRVARVVPSLIETGGYANPFLGVTTTEVSPIVAEANDLTDTRGVLVLGTNSGSPADGVLRASNRTEQIDGIPVPAGGDVILAIDGTTLHSSEDLQSVITRKRPGETVTLTILRGGERMEIEVELDERPPPGAS